MSKQDKYYEQLIQMMQGQIAALNNPQHNAAQNALTQQALSASDALQKGDYSNLPMGGMFFDFKRPAEDVDQYKKMINVNQGGNFAIAAGGDGEGAGNAMALQRNYLTDKFARDASQNYQDNVRNAAGTVRNALGEASGAQTGLDGQIMGAMNGLGGLIASMPKKTPWWQTLLGQAGGLASAASGAYAAGAF